MRLQIEKSLNECLLKAKQEIDDRNTVITQLSNDISGKDRILEENARAFQKK